MPATIQISRPTFADMDELWAADFNAVAVASATVPDATSGAPGVIQLTGDLDGAATLPRVRSRSVTPAKLFAAAAFSIWGNLAATPGDVQEIGISSPVRTFLQAITAEEARTAIGVGTGGGGGIDASQITGQLIASQIGAVNATAITGSILAGQIGSVNASVISGLIQASQIQSITASLITGQLSASQIGSVNASTIAGTLTASQIGSVNATAITGLIQATQINSLAANQITGSIQSSQIQSLAVTKLTGLISSAQIDTLQASQITGSISAGQISSLAANQITGALTAGQIGAVNASVINGVIVTSQLADGVMNSLRLMGANSSFRLVARIASLPTLPNVDYPQGSVALRTSDRTFWKAGASAWAQVQASDELTGALTAYDITSVNASTINGLVTAAQIGSVNATAITGAIQAGQISSIAATQITGQLSATQIAAVNASSITGSISAGQIGSVNASALAGLVSSAQTAFGVGANMVPNSGPYLTSIDGWAGAYNSTGLTHTVTNAAVDAPGWNPDGNGAVYSLVAGTPSSGVFDVLVRQSGSGSDLFPVIPGTRYEASAFVGAHRCSASVIIFWYDGANNYISEWGSATYSGLAGGASLANWHRPYTFATAPANARRAGVGIRGWVFSSQTNPCVFACRAHFGEAGVNQTEPTPWAPGGIGIGLNGGGIINGSISADKIGGVYASVISGGIVASQITSVAAAAITGQITSTQISSVAAASITGSITSSQIASVAAVSITGTITAGQIAGVNAAAISGTISAAQIGSIDAGTITVGLLQDSQIGGLNAGKLNAGTIAAARIGAGSITADKLSVTALSAITADIGAVTAGTINLGSGMLLSKLEAGAISQGNFEVANQPGNHTRIYLGAGDNSRIEMIGSSGLIPAYFGVKDMSGNAVLEASHIIGTKIKKATITSGGVNDGDGISFVNDSNKIFEYYGINLKGQGDTWPVRVVNAALVLGSPGYGSNFSSGRVYFSGTDVYLYRNGNELWVNDSAGARRV
ncbi:beta strand repeat-containing protein [Nibricoccus sp. IMCC34717]|uniref:beta strand repeat-containing protein n=1 Tax=Nibricoccus sp. IMCC34717 TaxID=3034021 RepID=UPI0038509507